jgi:hypothetical protein
LNRDFSTPRISTPQSIKFDPQALQNTIAALQQEIAYLRQLFGMRGTSRPKSVLPDPEKFSKASQYYT